MTSLREAIAARMDANAGKPAKAFEPNPELEEWGRKLDSLREHSPTEYDHPGLERIRTQVDTYRRRKAQLEENQ